MDFTDAIGVLSPIELCGLDIMHAFAEFLLPDLDTSKEPPQGLTELARNGNFGLKTGTGVYDWSKRDGQALLAARADRLFQHLTEDKSDT